jgi:hypothetical protein
MLLGVPNIYDQPSFSFVNTEVDGFNKRLYSLSYIFNHVRFLRSSTERKHHTNHGFHLNKKGKSWIANNIVKGIEDWVLPSWLFLLIVLPWKSSNYTIPHKSKPTKGM